MIWRNLSSLDIAADDPLYSEAVRRVLGRLGDYAEIITRPLNMRPTSAALLGYDGERVEVRISSAATSIVLVIGPDADIAGEIFWLRTMAARSLPAPPLILHDTTGARVPFSYAILGYVGGATLAECGDEAMVRVAARQLGRTVRRMHQAPAPGVGRPSPAGRWPQYSWSDALRVWLQACGAVTLAEQLLGSEQASQLWAETLDHPDLDHTGPRLLHGALGPGRALVAAGESIQLSALVRPGGIVAGDPLLDVAAALAPGQPPEFRQGFLEGYAAAGPLDISQRVRLRRLGLLAAYASAATSPTAPLLTQLPILTAAELRFLRAEGQ